jgi:hypothetical protein
MGIARFPDLTVLLGGRNLSFTASSPGLTSAVSMKFTVR